MGGFLALLVAAPLGFAPAAEPVPLPAPVQAQLQYVQTYWNDYNLDQYGDFNSWGGDCMNFVSQSLAARGWLPGDEWFNDAQSNWAPAWVHVPSFDEYLTAHPEFGAHKIGLDRRELAQPGDIVVYDWDADGSLDHAEVIIRIEDSRLLTAGHSDVDSWMRDVDTAIQKQHPGATAAIWRIP